MKNGPVKTVADMKGRVAATNVVGSGTDIGMRTLLRKYGLEDKRDYSVIEVSYFSMKDMLRQRKADLITTIHSTVLDPELLAMSRPLFYLRDAMGVTAILFRVARTPFIEKNRVVLVDYFEDETRALHWYLDPKNHKEAVEIVAKFTKEPPEHFDHWLFTKADIYRHPDNIPDLKALQSNLKTQKDAGFLSIDIDVTKFADLSLVEEAAKRVKK
jgi:NitT/TauT family transport system substrate-binding protein